MRRAFLAGLLAILLAAPAYAGAGPLFVVRGGGWGHGVGLSQCGAYGLAQQGLTYDGILANYYPGTQLGPAPLASIRVLLADSATVSVSSKAPFTATDANGQVVALPAGAATLRANLALTAPGVTASLAPPVRFTPGTAPLELASRYRGELVVSVNGSLLRVVNELPLEQYLYGVVPGEMPASWAPEALKAQAVAARSYALANRSTRGVFDVYADTRSQVYGGIAKEDKRTSAAIDATAGQVLLFKGKVASTFFFASSGGRTAAIEDVWDGNPIPYLVSVDDPFDAVCETHHRWGPFLFTGEQLSSRLGGPAQLLDVTTTIDGSGRVDELALVGRGGTVTVEGTAVRSALDLKSALFSVGVLALDPVPRPATFGSSVQLTGVARGIEGAVLEATTDGTTWAPVAQLVVGEDGRFVVPVRALRPSFYRVSAPGFEEVAGGLPQAGVGVAPRVRLSPTLTGRVQPKLAGATVQIQARKGKRWRTVLSTVVDARGVFAATAGLPPGEYRARVSPSAGLFAGVSAPVSVAAQ